MPTLWSLGPPTTMPMTNQPHGFGKQLKHSFDHKDTPEPTQHTSCSPTLAPHSLHYAAPWAGLQPPTNNMQTPPTQGTTNTNMVHRRPSRGDYPIQRQRRNGGAQRIWGLGNEPPSGGWVESWKSVESNHRYGSRSSPYDVGTRPWPKKWENGSRYNIFRKTQQ